MKHLSLILLFVTVVAMVASCNNSTTKPESVAYDPDGKCTVGKNQFIISEQKELLRDGCETLFIRDTLIRYKDTIYDDTVTKIHNYIGFVYLNRYTSNTDTILKRRAEKSNESAPCGSEPVYCELDSSGTQKTFSCEVSGWCYMYETLQSRTVLPDSKNLIYASDYFTYCYQSGYKCVIDTIYRDAFHTTLRKDVYDTLFLNYGANAWTDYIPAIKAPPFDTAAFRNALDTLDTQDEIFGMDTLFTGYNVSINGLPKWVVDEPNNHCVKQDSMVVCAIVPYYRIRYLGTYYPSVYEKKPFYLANWLDEPLERDTVITWTLHYRYRGGGGNKDSLTIQTLFKGISH
jgi:hypothetical protein